MNEKYIGKADPIKPNSVLDTHKPISCVSTDLPQQVQVSIVSGVYSFPGFLIQHAL